VDRETKHQVQELMVRLADGDRAAFDPLYAILWPVVRRFAERALSGSADAEDAAQSALIKVFSRSTEFDRNREALPWILGVVAFECRTFRQRTRRRREAPPPPNERIDTEPSPEQATLALELEAHVRQVLGDLSPLDEEALRALITGQRPAVPGATFRKRLERALERFRIAWRSRHGS
jgi:RNA polymerase sigma-70 factor, ECF subfamily